MLEAGVDPSYQLQPAVWVEGCKDPDKTSEGWTRDSLAEFLRFLDAKAVRVLTIWFGNALLTPKTEEVCPWVMPMLRNWALNQSLDGP